MRRVLIYAVIYGSIGAMIGVCVALYTADVEALPSKKVVAQNGSATKSGQTHSSSHNKTETEVAEPITNPVEPARED
jgi:hypothetical protein